MNDALTPSQVQDLETAFRHGCSHEEAAAYAHVTLKALEDRISSTLDSGWYAQCRLSANGPHAKARIVVGEQIEAGDLPTSQWFLERKKREEFGKAVEQLPPAATYNILLFKGDKDQLSLPTEIYDKIIEAEYADGRRAEKGISKEVVREEQGQEEGLLG